MDSRALIKCLGSSKARVASACAGAARQVVSHGRTRSRLTLPYSLTPPPSPPPADATNAQVLAGFAGTCALFAANNARANTPIDLFDDRAAKKKGFDLIYEARELDLPQNVRDGMTQARTDLKATVERVKESEKRLDSALEPVVAKAYW
jgi:hypothetical protein